MPQKYAVLTVSGQSNAVGYDESPVYEVGGYAPHPRLKQLGLYDEYNLTIIPLTYSPEDVQDMRTFSHPATPDKLGTKGIHLPLGHLLLEQLPADYQLLVIPVAYGGTYFGSEEHGLGTYDPEPYVAIPATTDTNQFAGTGATTDILTAHFGNNAYETVIAPRVYAQMREAGVFDGLLE